MFNSGASAFTITDNSFAFTINGIGVTNNSANAQNFVVGVDGVGGRGTLTFKTMQGLEPRLWSLPPPPRAAGKALSCNSTTPLQQTMAP